MNLQQMEYIVAVAKYKHFARAAEACHVTQPTLSMMIKKLEQELSVTIFDRRHQPIALTEMGKLLVEQAQVVLAASAQFTDIAAKTDNSLEGKISLGIIPTVAPYLIPRFISSLLKNFPSIHLSVEELTTDVLLEKLQRGAIDLGILSSPLLEQQLVTHTLYQEELYLYGVSTKGKKYVVPADIKAEELWLLEEGHCLRSQILNLCELRPKHSKHFAYQSGSLETLKHLVEQHEGLTILPELATHKFSAEQKAMLGRFKSPAPVREISMIHRKRFYKHGVRDAIIQEIKTNVPEVLTTGKPVNRLEIY